jgi:transposase
VDGFQMLDVGKNGRSRFSRGDKRRIVLESETAGVSAVARRYSVSDSCIWEWRRQKRLGQLDEDAGSVFIPVQVTADPVSAPVDFRPAQERESQSARGLGLMEIDLGGDRLVRVDREVDADALRRVIDALGAR